MVQRQGTSRCTHSSRRERGAGVVHGWSEMRGCVSVYSCVLVGAGLLSRYLGGWRWRVASGSSRTRASIGSSMLRWRAPKTTPGGTICHVGSQSVVGEGAGVAVLPLTSPTDVRSMSVRRQVAERKSPGHWEADLMLFRTYGQAVLTLHERHSRLIVAARPQGKASALVADAMCELLSGLPPEWRQTVTFDNGTEFARHYQLHELGIDTFFCDTYSPWQKGGVENAIGRLRRMLPRKTDLANVSDERFTQLVQIYNNTPRKCLGYYTPAEILSKQLLHLKCESTFPPARE